jgi:hypothetical protein
MEENKLKGGHSQMGEDEVCKAHSGIVEAVNDMKKKVDKLDGRLWSLVILALVQLIGIAAMLFKG